MRCPYPDCRKEFDRLLMFIDEFKLSRETYYACPHCKSRVDIIMTNQDPPKLSPKGKQVPPSNFVCPYYFGHLSFCRESPIPEICLTCTRITECMTRNI